MAENQGLEDETVKTGAGGDALSEELTAQRLAARMELEYIDLENFEIDAELFRSIPVDLMFRYNFVPRRKIRSGLEVVVADPADVLMIDELELLVGMSISVCVGTPTAIQEILKKSESSQRVLEEATEDFRLQIVTEDEETGEETLTIDKLDVRLLADHQAGRLHDLQRATAPGIGYPHRDARPRRC